MVSSVSNGQNSHAGLQLGVGATALAGAGLYASSKFIDKTTAMIAKNARQVVYEQRAGIDKIRHSQDLLKKLGSANEKLYQNADELCKQSEALISDAYKNASSMFRQRKQFKSLNIKSSFFKALPLYLAAGAIVDIANNKQRSKSAPNAVTDNGNPYVETNMGKKLGWALGLVSEAAMLVLNRKAYKMVSPSSKVLSFGISALGGYVLGSIADKLSNKKAAKAADKNA